jgi:hypothetical protein
LVEPSLPHSIPRLAKDSAATKTQSPSESRACHGMTTHVVKIIVSQARPPAAYPNLYNKDCENTRKSLIVRTPKPHSYRIAHPVHPIGNAQLQLSTLQSAPAPVGRCGKSGPVGGGPLRVRMITRTFAQNIWKLDSEIVLSPLQPLFVWRDWPFTPGRSVLTCESHASFCIDAYPRRRFAP